MLFQLSTNRTEMLMILLLASQLATEITEYVLAKKQIEENEQEQKKLKTFQISN
jgi:hypothetical protein